MAYAKAEQKPVGVRLGQRLLGGGHCDGIAAVDVSDAGGHDDSLGLRQEQACLCERLASCSLDKPKRAVSYLFQFGSRFLHARRRQDIELKIPNSKRAKLHFSLSHGFPPVWQSCSHYDERAASLGTNTRRAQKTAPLIKAIR